MAFHLFTVLAAFVVFTAVAAHHCNYDIEDEAKCGKCEIDCDGKEICSQKCDSVRTDKQHRGDPNECHCCYCKKGYKIWGNRCVPVAECPKKTVTPAPED